MMIGEITNEYTGLLKLSLKWSGRFSRPQFGLFWIGTVLINIVLFLLVDLTGLDLWLKSMGLGDVVGLIWLAILVVFNYGAAIWRFHDIDKSGWYILLMFIPIVSIFVFLYLLFEPGKEIGMTRWG